jgi:hypothetical protein
VVDLTTTDHTFARRVHGIRTNVDGTFYATLVGEIVAEGSRQYVVAAGDMVLGTFASVERATSDAGFQNATALLGVILPEAQ